MKLREVSRRVPGRIGRRAGVTQAGPLVIGIIVALAPVFSGCASRSPAEAENREIRLTQDGVVKLYPRISPDGAWIAYSAVTSQSNGAVAVFVLPRQGGTARKVSPDSISAIPMTWSTDAATIYCRSFEGRDVYQIGLDGSVRRIDPGDPFARMVAISPDGQTRLLIKFNQDNRDLGIVENGGPFKFVALTPAWEQEAVTGPGPGEITVVSTPSYQAPTSTISVWSPKTGTFTPLPLPEGQKSSPAWSSDGKTLAFCYRRDGKSDVWLYDAKNARSAQITDEPEDSDAPTWTPDGDWLAICRSTKISHIYVGDPMKEGRRQLTEGADYDIGPEVSPDGKWVAFIRKFAGGEQRGKSALCVVPTAGGPVRQLDLKGVAIPGKAIDALAWSPDSRQIAFSGSEGAAKTDIYRVGRDDEGLARVTVEPGDEIEPRWSPDGKYITYTRVGGGQARVAIVPSSGGLPRFVSPEGVLSEGGMVSPHSDRIVFATFRTDGSAELWMAPIEAPEKRTMLVKSKLMVWPVYWSHDGKDVLFVRGSGTNYEMVERATDTGSETRIGRHVMLPSGKDMFTVLSPEGAKYKDLYYPGGIVVADGQDRSDLFLIRARMPVKPTALYMREDRFLCSGFVGLAGCF